jgi:hypothetical protein
MQTWQGYITALNQQSHPTSSMPQVAPYETTSSEYGKTGFMDLLVKNPQIQARYDAMQGTWEGPEASEKAVSKGLFKTEAMPLEQKQTASKKEMF